MPNYDAILVPGGGVREGGLLPTWVERRLDLAIRLREQSYIVTLSAGTTHRPPPRDANGYPIFESIAAARYLIAAGVPPDRILAETHSWDTVGNAFFSRVVHLEPQGLRNLLVITSDFHLPRTELAFNWVYGLKPEQAQYEIHFVGVADPDMDPSVLHERREKERKSLEGLAPLTRRLTTMRDFHRWLFTEHSAYSAAGKGFIPDALRSY
jgi:uncharacterized SAM-binding protein YcdF (DUF218 family)